MKINLAPNKLYYRVGHEKTQQGLWYDEKGNFTGLIHSDFNFCINNRLPMPFDPSVVGWMSVTETLEDLFHWFPIEDILRLQDYGWYVTVYEATDVKAHDNHLVISQSTSKVKFRLRLSTP